MCLEATLRLLRPPRGFEGFGAVAVDLDTRDLAVADGRDMSYLRFHGEPASPASAPLPVQRHDTTVGSSQNLVNSDFVVIQDGEEVVEVALDGLGPAIFRTRANRDSGSYPRRPRGRTRERRQAGRREATHPILAALSPRSPAPSPASIALALLGMRVPGRVRLPAPLTASVGALSPCATGPTLPTGRQGLTSASKEQPSGPAHTVGGGQ